MLRLLVVLLMAVPLSLAAQTVYKSVDENGNPVFSDTPPTNGSAVKNIQVSPTNSAPPPPDIPRPPKPVVEEEEIEATVEITSPAPDTTIAIGYGGDFSVSARTNPPLGAGTSAQLLMDGVAVGAPQSVTSWALTNVFRGAHVLSVTIVDAGGEQVAISPPVTVYVRRASQLH